MGTREPGFTRRQALRALATYAGFPALILAADKKPCRRMALSFYCDDTSPYVAGAKAFQTFLDYCAEHGIAGESSAILGAGGHTIAGSGGTVQNTGNTTAVLAGTLVFAGFARRRTRRAGARNNPWPTTCLRPGSRRAERRRCR